LIVPSALAPDEANWLLNPDHSDFARIRIHSPEAFTYDARFFTLIAKGRGCLPEFCELGQRK
jgi:hypothetical protein